METTEKPKAKTKTAPKSHPGWIEMILNALDFAGHYAAFIARIQVEAKHKVNRVFSHILRQILLLALMVIGLIFVLIGLVKSASEVTGMSEGASYAVVGVVVWLASVLILKRRSE